VARTLMSAAPRSAIRESYHRIHVTRATHSARAVFFDRDGTLMEDAHYCGDPSQVRVYPGVPEALRKLKAAGFHTFVVTNQSGIGRGLITEQQYRAVEAEFLRQVGEGLLDATYFCPDAPGVPSTRRKPAPGMLFEALRDFGIDPADLASSYVIGDKSADIECGHRAGAWTILVQTGYGPEQLCRPDFTVQDVIQAVEVVLQRVASLPAKDPSRNH